MQDAFAREQLLTAHAAHELRTPIAGLRTTLELILSRPRSVDEHRHAAEDSLLAAKSLQNIVDSVLELARASDASGLSAPSVEHISALLHQAWGEHEDLARARELELNLEISGELTLETHRALLGRVLDNLIENAVTYADHGGRIHVRASRQGDSVVLCLSNRCAGAPHDVAEHAFDPLWRGEAARSPNGRHVGLGLSLCRRIVGLLDGGIEARYLDGQFTIELRLPSRSRP